MALPQVTTVPWVQSVMTYTCMCIVSIPDYQKALQVIINERSRNIMADSSENLSSDLPWFQWINQNIVSWPNLSVVGASMGRVQGWVPAQLEGIQECCKLLHQERTVFELKQMHYTVIEFNLYMYMFDALHSFV